MSWHARMISADEDFDGAPLLRREFSLEEGHGAVRSASLTLSALGVVEARLNGRPVSGALLTPGWSSYEWRIRYSVTDVTALLAPASVLALSLGNGWYRGRLGWGGFRSLYGEELGAFAELEIVFEDGAVQRVVTDDSWSAGPSAVLENDLYDGETIDARRRDDAWLAPGFTGEGWTGVHALDLDLGLLVPYIGPAVSRQQEIAPVRIWTSPSGRTLIDYGQNLVGWIRLRAHGAAGTKITVRAHLHLPRVPLRGGPGVARRARSRRCHGCRHRLGPHPHRHVRVLRPAAEPVPRERRVGHARQLRRRADRLPAARRAARVDRRHRRLRPDRRVPLRHRRVPVGLASRPRRRAAAPRRPDPVRHP
jgi:hypothetical protein